MAVIEAAVFFPFKIQQASNLSTRFSDTDSLSQSEFDPVSRSESALSFNRWDCNSETDSASDSDVYQT